MTMRKTLALCVFGFALGQAQTASAHAAEKKPKAVSKQSLKTTQQTRNLDPIVTGGAGDVRTKQIWVKMQRHEKLCGQCSLNQPFPDDDPSLQN